MCECHSLEYIGVCIECVHKMHRQKPTYAYSEVVTNVARATALMQFIKTRKSPFKT